MHTAVVVQTFFSGGALLVAALAYRNARAARQKAAEANVISRESNEISKSARDDARSAAVEAVWNEVLIAVGELQTLDLTRGQDLGPPLAGLRIKLTLLVDRLEWPAIDVWLEAERGYGIALLREGLESWNRMRTQLVEEQDPVSFAVQFSAPFHTWVYALMSNLRLIKREGYVGNIEKMQALTRIAAQRTAEIYERNSWGPVPAGVPGVAPLA